MTNRFSYDQMSGGRRAAAGGAGGVISMGGRGGAMLVPVISKTDFTMRGDATGSSDVTLAQGIDTSGWVSGAMLVRFHSKGAVSTSATMQVLAQNVSLVPEEPDVLYLSTGAAVASSTTLTLNTTSAGLLDVSSLVAPIGSMVRVILRFTQGANLAQSVFAYRSTSSVAQREGAAMNRMARKPHVAPPTRMEVAMHGREGDEELVSIISKTEFTFDGRGGTVQDNVLVAGIDSRDWKSFRTITRVHTKNAWSATASLKVIVQNCSIVPERPSLVFIGGDTGGSSAINHLSIVPLLDVTTTTQPVGDMLRVLLRWDQGATEQAAQTVSLSIDLVGSFR